MRLYKQLASSLKGEGPGPDCNPSVFWLFAKQRGACFHCGEMMTPQPAQWRAGGGLDYPNGYTREHILPRSRGGKGRGSLTKLVLAHQRCNARRRDALPTPTDLLKAKLLYLPVRFDFAELVKGCR